MTAEAGDGGIRLIALAVEEFAAVRKATVTLGPGLTILHGPNDLGKSTLAEAVRAALLLPHATKAAERYVTWDGAEAPRVQLSFAADRAQWRVSKRFGKQGSALLERSSDAGATFTAVAKGREVDGHLRTLLRVGVPAPGGSKSRIRDIPDTFLVQVLLGAQDKVGAVLSQGVGLAGDLDESGRDWLADVLATLAADPLFQDVMARAQARVDEAFTTTGRKKTGRSSPWTRLRDAIGSARERRDAAALQVEQSAVVEQAVAELGREHEEAQASYRDAKREHERLVLARDRHRSREARERAAHAAAEALGQAVQQRSAREASRVAAAEAESELLVAQGVFDDASAAHAAAQQRRREVEEALARAEAEDADAAEVAALGRLLEEEQVVRDRLGRLEARLRALGGAIHLGASRVEQREAESAAVAAVAKLQAGRREHADAMQDLKRVEAAQDLRVQRKLERRLDDLDARSLKAAELRAKAAALIGQADSLAAQLKERPVPGSEQLAEVRGADQARLLAERSLDAHLELDLRPERALDVAVRADGGEPVSHQVKAMRARFEAARELELSIDGVGVVTVRGGGEVARAKLAAAEKSWDGVVRPVLAAAEVDDVAALDRLCEAARGREEEERRLRAQAVQSIEQAKDREVDASGRAGLVAQRQALIRKLASFDQAALEALLVQQGGALEEAVAAAERAVADRAEQVRRLTDESSKLDATSEAVKRRVLELSEQLDEAELPTGLFLQEELDKAQEAEAGLRRKLVELTEARAAIVDQRGETRKGASAAADDARAAAKRAEQAREVARARVDSARTAVASTKATLVAREEAVAGIDFAALETAAAAARERLGEPADAVAVSDEDVLGAQERLARAAERARDVERRAAEGRGSLMQVGGSVARDQRKDAADHLERLEEEERVLDLDYRAWQLLTEELAQAQQTQGTHLGRALAGPTAARFGALTAGRYGALELGPDLEAKGIRVADALQDIDRLSVGTRDQLATILRLVIAEQLGTFVLLDDHLVHSDAVRASWFRRALAAASATTQVIVLTCRPDLYVDETTTEASVVDLAALIDRVEPPALTGDALSG